MNNEDMSDVVKNLSGMLNNANIPDNVMDLLNGLQGSSNSSVSNSSSSSDIPPNSSSSGISPEMLEKLSSMFNNSNTSNGSSNSSQGSGIDMETLLKISSIINKMNSSQNDARANLLLSLKPYLKESRKSKVEQYVKLLNMSKVLEIINPNGGENAK